MHKIYNVELSLPQTEVYTSKAPSVAAVAGFGAGKTDTALYRCISTMIEFPTANMLYLAPTFPLIKDIWYPKIEHFLTSLGIKYHINRGDNVVNIYGLGKIFCRTMEHPGRIIGFEVLDAFLDELDILPKEKALEVWRKAKARCRMTFSKINQVFLTTTPEGFQATYQLFQKNPIPGSHLVQMSTYSNEVNLPPGYIQELKNNYPANLIEAYIMGVFTNLVSMPVWTCYHRQYNCSYESVKKTDNLIIGMDFNVGRGCAVVYVARKDGLHAVDEVYNSYDTIDTIRVLNNRYPNHNMTVYPDASGKSRKSVNATISDISMLKEHGFAVQVNRKNPTIKDRIMATNSLFLNGAYKRFLFINPLRCQHLADALEQQVYDNNGLPTKGDGTDDLTDAASYPIAYLFPIKKIETQKEELTL